MEAGLPEGDELSPILGVVVEEEPEDTDRHRRRICDHDLPSRGTEQQSR